jgi:uncharacterized protein (DUF4213/DUF364 family)
MIINDTFEKIRQYVDIDTIVISEVRVGLHLCAVRLSDGSTGVSTSIPDVYHQRSRSERDYGDFTPCQIIGKSVGELFRSPKTSNLISTLRVSVLNALSGTLIETGKFKILENVDPIEIPDFSKKGKVVLVGGFNSYISKICAIHDNIQVLEFDEDSLNPGFRKYFVPASNYQTVLANAEIVIITGMTLVNNTIDGLLKAIPPNAQTIVTGPSSSVLPNVLFEHNVEIIGSIRITNPDLLLDLAGQGGSGFHLFRYCAQKIVILNEKKQ